MKYINSQIKNVLKIILSVMIVFSSILVINPNSLLAEGETQETVVKQEEVVEKQNEVIEQEIIEEKQDETIIEEVKEETPSETVDVVQEEQIVEEETLTEEVTEDTKDINKAPLAMNSMTMLGVEQTYTVTFRNGLTKVKDIQVSAGTKINRNDVPGIEYVGRNSDKKQAVWYYRVGTLIFYKEYEWDFSNMTVDKDITLYAKFVNIGADGDFDFRVKHEKSNVLSEFNTGTYTNVESGYTYSYYNYNEKGVEFSYNEGATPETYDGTTFDLAIQEANAGDTIEILRNITIQTPITIWADVNLNLNGKTITYETSLITKIINFINNIWKVLSHSNKLIIPIQEDFNPAIFVYNSTITISNGTIINKAGGTGHGIVVYSGESKYKVNLNGLTVTAKSGADAVASGYEGKIEQGSGLTVNNAKGEVIINSGYYGGDIRNYNPEGHLIINRGNFTKDPRLDINVDLSNSYLYVEDKSEKYRYRVGDYEYPTVIVDSNDEEIANLSLTSALNEVESGQKIRLVKDVTLTEDLIIDPKGKSITIDANGHNVIRNNNSKILIEDSSASTQGEVSFINTDTYYSGFVNTPIIANDKGILVIESGYYHSVSGSNAIVKGGYFVLKVDDSCLDTDSYVCNPLDQMLLNTFNYNVVLKDNLNVAKNLRTNIEYTSLITAIENANSSDTIEILKEINLVNENVEINKTLTISLGTNSIYSHSSKSFTISGDSTVVTFNGNETTKPVITNNYKANNEKTVVFEIKSNSKLVINNVDIDVETQNCNDKELIAFNTIRSGASLELHGSRIIVTNQDYLNKYITAIKNESLGATIIIDSSSNITMKPCLGGCEKVTAIYNSGDNSNGNPTTIDIVSSTIQLQGVGNQSDYIEYNGIYDESTNSKITIDSSNLVVTNQNGTSYAINVNGNSSLDIKNSSTISLAVTYDDISTHNKIGILSKGNSIINDSTLMVTAMKGNARGLDIYGGVAELNGATVIVTSAGEGYCLSSNENGKISVIDGYYRSSNNRIVYCNNNGTVEISGGHFTNDVTEWLARNYKCIYDPVTNGVTYDYSVSLSKCVLSVSVANDGTLVLNYNVTYDTFMLNNPDDFGVRFTCAVPELSEFNNMVFSITETKNKKSSSNNQLISKLENSKKGVYSFNIPARLMDAIIDVEIMDLSKGHIYHERDYSVEKYYYDILNQLTNKQEQVYDLMRDLAATSLNFGSYCQETLNGQSDESQLVNSKLDQGDGYEDFSGGTKYEKGFTDAYDEEIKNEEGGNSKEGELEDYIKIKGHALSLQETTTLRCKFILKDIENNTIDNYKAYYRNKSKNQNDFIEIKPVLREGMYCLDIPGIRSYDFSDEYELKIVRKDKTCLITYSPLNYIHNAYDVDKLLSRALYTYYKVARFFYEATR